MSEESVATTPSPQPSPPAGEGDAGTVLLCRFCGHLNPSPDESETGIRCAQCGAFSGLEAVAVADAQRRSRRVRLDFLRSRLARAALVVVPLLVIGFWILWEYTGLPPDPPQPSTAIGDTAAAAIPGDWPQAGGGVTNASAAVGPSLPASVVPQTQWEYVAGAPIVAPPAVSGDRVYVTAEDGSIVALERDTGAVVWRYDSGMTAAVTPAVSDGLVFAVFKPGVVAVLDAATGEAVWSKRLSVASLPSPTVADGRLFVAETDQKRLLALDAATGATLWDYQLDDWVVAPPAINDGLLIATANDARIHVLDVNTGRLRMIYNAGAGRWTRDGPTVTDELLHVSSNGVKRDGFRARIWGLDYRGHRYPLERPIYYVRAQLAVWGFTRQPPIQQGTVWSTRTGGKQPYRPAVSGQTLVIADARGPITALDAETGAIRWETDLDVDIVAGATVAGPVALIGDERGVVTALALSDGSLQWTAALSGAITASPIVSGNLMLVPFSANGGVLAALSLDGGE